MPSPFTISTTSNTVILNVERKGEAAFTVTNISGRLLRGRGVLQPLEQTAAQWLIIAGETERDFAIAATQQYVVQVTVPPDATPGAYTFRLDEVGVDNPDENFTQGPVVAFQVAAQSVPPPPRPFPWWIVAIAAGVVLIVLAAVILPRLLAPQRPRPNATLIPLDRSTVTLDAACNAGTEYKDAAVLTYSDVSGQPGTLYLKHDGNWLYVCVVGPIGTDLRRWYAVQLDTDNGSEPQAQSNDIGLLVTLRTGSASAVAGTGAGGYAPASIVGWSARVVSGANDIAEYRIPIALTGGAPCYEVFGMSVYHYWLRTNGDDYGWPSNQWWDQPQTWERVALDCQ